MFVTGSFPLAQFNLPESSFLSFPCFCTQPVARLSWSDLVFAIGQCLKVPTCKQFGTLAIL